MSNFNANVTLIIFLKFRRNSLPQQKTTLNMQTNRHIWQHNDIGMPNPTDILVRQKKSEIFANFFGLQPKTVKILI